MAKLRIVSLELYSQPTPRLRVYQIELSSVVTPTPVLPANQTVESQALVTLTATISETPSAWDWTITGTPTATLSGAGATRTFTAPATVEGAVYAVTAQATVSGVPTAVASTQITVRAHQWWVKRGTVWKPFAQPVRLA